MKSRLNQLRARKRALAEQVYAAQAEIEVIDDRIIEIKEAEIDALPRRRQGPRGPRNERPYPTRMHEKKGILYHVYRNRWRRLGPASDPEAAWKRYYEFELFFVDPSRRERPVEQAPVAEPAKPQVPEPASSLASCQVVPSPESGRMLRWYGYYGGGTPCRVT